MFTFFSYRQKPDSVHPTYIQDSSPPNPAPFGSGIIVFTDQGSDEFHHPTPNEVWNKVKLPTPRPIRVVDPVQPAIDLVKELHADDPKLPIIRITQRSPLRLIA